MAGKKGRSGRKPLSDYERYSRKFDRMNAKKAMNESKMSELEYKSTITIIPGEDINDKTDELLYRQKYGYSRAAGEARADFVRNELHQKYNTETRYMTHTEFAEKYGDELSKLYEELGGKEGYMVDGVNLISAFVFGSP